MLEGVGDIASFEPIGTGENVWLIPGDLKLSLFEDELSHCWALAADRKPRAFRVLSALYRVIVFAARKKEAEIVLVDVGPNLGSLNRSALISSDYVITPLAPDRYSLLGLENLGDRLFQWREEWKERLNKNSDKTMELPQGTMTPLGYIVMQHSERAGRPAKSYRRWIERIPQTFHSKILNDDFEFDSNNDPFCLAHIKHYRSLIAMAMEKRKPIFELTSADGAFGAHYYAVTNCRMDFQNLVRQILNRINIQDVSQS